MHEYLRAFQNIEQSVEHLLTNEHNSLEIKQSAKSLKHSVQPCTEELKKSAIRLKGLVEVVFADLGRAEDIWNSKQKSAQAATHEIWEQLGELSGSHVRIIKLKEQCKKEAINQFQSYWNEQIEQLRKGWFIETKGKFKKGISWGEKEKFIKIIKLDIGSALPRYNRFIKESLILINQEINAVKWEKIQEHMGRETQTKNEWNQWEKLIHEIETKFGQPTEHLPEMLRDL